MCCSSLCHIVLHCNALTNHIATFSLFFHRLLVLLLQHMDWMYNLPTSYFIYLHISYYTYIYHIVLNWFATTCFQSFPHRLVFCRYRCCSAMDVSVTFTYTCHCSLCNLFLHRLLSMLLLLQRVGCITCMYLHLHGQRQRLQPISFNYNTAPSDNPTVWYNW